MIAFKSNMFVGSSSNKRSGLDYRFKRSFFLIILISILNLNGQNLLCKKSTSQCKSHSPTTRKFSFFLNESMLKSLAYIIKQKRNLLCFFLLISWAKTKTTKDFGSSTRRFISFNRFKFNVDFA